MLHRGKPIPNMLAGGAIFAVGDIAAQRLTRDATGGFELDASRLGGAACLGAVWSGLCTPAVYHAAEPRFPGRAPKAVVLKMLVTCAVLSTVGNRITMFARRALRVPRGVDEASSLRDCARDCDRVIARAIRADLRVWSLYNDQKSTHRAPSPSSLPWSMRHHTRGGVT